MIIEEIDSVKITIGYICDDASAYRYGDGSWVDYEDEDEDEGDEFW